MDPALIAHGYNTPLPNSERRYMLASFLPWDASDGRTDTPDVARNTRLGLRYADQLSRSMYSGAIVIFHDGVQGTNSYRVEATLLSLDRFLTTVKAQGYEVLTMSEAIERTVD